MSHEVEKTAPSNSRMYGNPWKITSTSSPIVQSSWKPISIRPRICGCWALMLTFSWMGMGWEVERERKDMPSVCLVSTDVGSPLGPLTSDKAHSQPLTEPFRAWVLPGIDYAKMGRTGDRAWEAWILLPWAVGRIWRVEDEMVANITNTLLSASHGLALWNPHNQSYSVLIILIYWWNWGSERLGNSPKVTQGLWWRARLTEPGHRGAELLHLTTALFCLSRKRNEKGKWRKEQGWGWGTE